MGFAITTQAAENRTMWKRIVTKPFGVPQPDRTEWKNSKGVTAYTQIRKCVMKFCQVDKISTRTCIFDDVKISISIKFQYMKYL